MDTRELTVRIIEERGELLDALKAIVDCWEAPTSHDTFVERLAPRIDDARKAITKATEDLQP